MMPRDPAPGKGTPFHCPLQEGVESRKGTVINMLLGKPAALYLAEREIRGCRIGTPAWNRRPEDQSTFHGGPYPARVGMARQYSDHFIARLATLEP